MEIAIGIPAYNEEKSIAVIITKLHKITNNIIVCNDGSKDLTGRIAEKMGATVVNHERNLGYGAGIRSLFQKARELNYDVLVTFDADGQHRVDDIKTVLEPIIKEEADLVIGSRILNNDTKNIPGYRKTGIKVITGIANAVTEIKVTDSQSGFRAYNRKALKEISTSEYGMSVSTEILLKAGKAGLRIKEVPITVLYEGDTSTHHPVPHGLSVVTGTVKFISIKHPLIFYGFPGIVLAVAGLILGGQFLQAYLNHQTIYYGSLLGTIVLLMLGTVLIVTAILLFVMSNLIREKQ